MDENIRKKILKQVLIDRKYYENKKVKYEINNIYRKCGLKINKNKIEELINDMNSFNYGNEKIEYLFKKKLKDDIHNLKILNLERVEKIIENLSKNDFTIPKKYKYKKDVAKYIRKLYREYKWLRTSHFKFLITENFKKFEEIEKIKLNRNEIVLCYNEANKIVCVYFFYLIDSYFDYLIDLVSFVFNDYNSITSDYILGEKNYLDYKDRRRENKIFEERI